MSKIMDKYEDFIINKYLTGEISNFMKEGFLDFISLFSTKKEKNKVVKFVMSHCKMFDGMKHNAHFCEILKEEGFEDRNEFTLGVKSLSIKGFIKFDILVDETGYCIKTLTTPKILIDLFQGEEFDDSIFTKTEKKVIASAMDITTYCYISYFYNQQYYKN